jgi:membrane protein YqaA with SNARE-associated domain
MKKSFFKEYRTFLYFIGWMAILVIVFALLQPLLLKWVNSNPDTKETYDFVKDQLAKNSLLWLGIITFLGALFFVAIPTDLVFAYYIVNSRYPWLPMLIFFLGTMLGRTVNYWFGYIFSGFVTRKVLHNQDFSNKFVKLEESILVFGNIIPFFPNEFYVTFLGTLKFNFWKYLLFNSLGKILKIIIIVLFVKYVVVGGFTIVNWFD